MGKMVKEEQKTGSLEPPRRSDSKHAPQRQAEIESGDLHQQAFRDVLSAAQVDPSHPSGVIAMGKASFEQLTAAAQEPLAALAAVRRRLA
jgi:hypothetical protein